MAEPVVFTPDGEETNVARLIDDVGLAEMTVGQLDFADTATPGARWELARFAMTVTGGQES